MCVGGISELGIRGGSGIVSQWGEGIREKKLPKELYGRREEPTFYLGERTCNYNNNRTLKFLRMIVW